MKILDLWKNTNLMTKILVGIIIGATLALLIPGLTPIALLGDLFVGALKSIAPILVGILVTASVSKAGKGLGGRFKTVITLYLASTLFAAVLAVFASRFFPVGIAINDITSATNSAPGSLSDIFKQILKDITTNPITALANANYLSILFWSVIIGLALKAVAGEKTINAISDLSDAVSKVVSWVIRCAPFGILGLVYTSVSQSGLEIFTTYGKLLLLLVGCMVAVPMIIHPAIIGFMLRRNPYPLIWKCLKLVEKSNKF